MLLSIKTLLPIGSLLFLTSLAAPRSGFSISGEAMRPGDYHRTVISSVDGSAQPYRFFIPEGYTGKQPMPLLVVLHGKWVNENTWFEVTRIKEYAHRRGYIVASPYGRGSEFYRGKAQQDVLDTIAEVRGLCNIDPERIYLLGHSMGGWGAWFVGLSHPDIFASICAMSGAAPIDLLPNALHLSPLIIHGDKDEIISVDHSREADHALSSLSVPHHYWERGGYGHLDNLINESLWAIFDWFDQKRRIARPFVVSLRIRTPLSGHAYWLEIVQTVSFPHLASLDAHVIEPDRLRITTSNVSQFIVKPAEAPVNPDSTVNTECDGEACGKFSVEPATIWSFSKSKSSGKWSVSAVSPASVPRYSSPVVTTLEKPLENVPPISALAEKVGDILREGTGADVVLLTDDMLTSTIPAGKVTADDLLSVYLYPDDRLGEFKTTGKDLLQFITLTGQQKEWWGNVQFSRINATLKKLTDDKLQVVSSSVQPQKTYRVLCPAPMARDLSSTAKILNITIAECLYDYARKGGSFDHSPDGRKRLTD